MISSPLRVPMLCMSLALLWLLPGVSHAARQPPPVGPSPAQAAPETGPAAGPDAPPMAAPEPRAVPGTQQDAPRRLMEPEEAWEPPARPSTPRGLRILAEVGAGIGGSLALGLGGGLLGLGVCIAASDGHLDEFEKLVCIIPIAVAAVAGLVVGFPIGTWIAGEGLGGNGSLLAALGFGTLGALVGAVLGGPAALLLLGVGSILGYELFQYEPAVVRSGARLQPLLSFSERGGPVLGLSARF